MKKVCILILVLVLVCSLFVGCNRRNRRMIDPTYKFDEAIIRFPDGTSVRGTCEGWEDWDDGSDEVQVVIDGVTYYTHSSNVVLIAH